MKDIDTLIPAIDLAKKADQPFPGDSTEYRQARQALLVEEINLRRQLWRVAEMRRHLPPGGEPPPYDFLDENGKTVTFADIFGRHDTLVTYFWMYRPERGDSFSLADCSAAPQLFYADWTHSIGSSFPNVLLIAQG